MTKIESLELELAARKMVEGTSLNWTVCLRHKYSYATPLGLVFYAICDVELALGIVEGKPVWSDSTIFLPNGTAHKAGDLVRSILLASGSWDNPGQDNYWDAESAAKEMDRLKAELASKQKEIDHWKDLEAQAACFVEVPIVMRTHFTGEPPYVGWEGLGLALTETIDELANAKKEIDNLQAKLDALMLEYCPEYMEDTQLLEWERNQRPVNPEEVYSPHTEVLK